MKKILGLDLGTNSIGWAVVNEAEKDGEKGSIVKLGVRTISYDNFTNAEGSESKNPVGDFCSGKSISCNAARTLKRSMRRNLQRYKLRRDSLIEILKENHWIDDSTILKEQGNRSTFETWHLRAKAATEEISLAEFARVLLMINKQRGYKSSRKAKGNEDGSLIDGMDIAKILYENDLTPGQYVLNLLLNGKKSKPDFYRSDLQAEFDKIWKKQKEFYPEVFTDAFYKELQLKNEKQTWAICAKNFKDHGLSCEGAKRTTKGEEQKLENYQWRNNALSQKLEPDQIAVVFSKVNSQINNTSGYLGAIGDRSKELYFHKITVGQYKLAELEKNPNYSLKNQVFYRQDYLDEFEKVWETQAKFHPELTNDLKHEIRDVVIFYQRKLKSQKGLVSYCELERREITLSNGQKKINGLKVCPKSSPLFQEFKIWQVLNNLTITDKETGEVLPTNLEERKKLFEESQIRASLSLNDVCRILGRKPRSTELNFPKLEGNRTLAALFDCYAQILETLGKELPELSKVGAKKYIEFIEKEFSALGFNTAILHFDSLLEGKLFEEQESYKLWHLLYSFEGDNSNVGDEKLVEKLQEKYGFDKNSAKILAGVTFQDDFGNLCTKAMRKILKFMKTEGLEYSKACEKAGYKHSKKSLTREELDKKIYQDKLELLPKNSLRNPVVEKILNQMVNVVNAIIDEYGKPDEIRIELARELKKSSQEREEMSKGMRDAEKDHEEIRKILEKEFGIEHVSRNDIIRYKLYRELKSRNYKTLYSNTYISPADLFSKKFDIEHIIPQSKVFDDSFSNKTIEARDENIKKGNMTAYDYVAAKGENALNDYEQSVNELYNNKIISRSKLRNLLCKEADIPSDFINRDLRDSQYIAKKAREMLEELVKFVVPTTGSITDRLREDWQLVNVMQELNWDKYNKLGLTSEYKDKDGRTIKRIDDWTKRNDHRHHAMDALTIAFTKRNYIQYLNNLNARVQKGVDEYLDLENVELSDLSKADRSKVVCAIENKELYRDSNGKLRFKPPMPLDEFRKSAKEQLENTIISIKSKNKVVTKNINRYKCGTKTKQKTQLTPRGQLHNETIYGSMKQIVPKEIKVDAKMTAEVIATVTKPAYRMALTKRLQEFNGNAKLAFTGKNALAKNPIYLDDLHTQQVPEKVKVQAVETVYTIRKEISKDLKIDKVIDPKIREILQERLMEFDNDAQKAFSDLDKNPIWLNQEKGIAIKRVTIKGASNTVPVHGKNDFVQTSNNHHVAIYKDANGNLQEKVVSFYEAVERANQGLPAIDKDFHKEDGWEFLFTMKRNEFFVFPNPETGFDPKQIDLMNPENYHLISPNLFRVQKLATKNYFFRHHLETTVQEKTSLNGITYKLIQSLEPISKIVKVRVNHIGKIVSVGEF